MTPPPDTTKLEVLLLWQDHTTTLISQSNERVSMKQTRMVTETTSYDPGKAVLMTGFFVAECNLRWYPDDELALPVARGLYLP